MDIRGSRAHTHGERHHKCKPKAG